MLSEMKQHDLHSSTAIKYDWYTLTAFCELKEGQVEK